MTKKDSLKKLTRSQQPIKEQKKFKIFKSSSGII